MPEISRFYGILIKMYCNDHAPSHFHARYGNQEVLTDIKTLDTLTGKLPPRAKGLVIEWAAIHQDELYVAWQRARSKQPLGQIEPLP
ncbi:MAG: DUF4160 domain-containing protein [Deinococcota bacterium]